MPCRIIRWRWWRDNDNQWWHCESLHVRQNHWVETWSAAKPKKKAMKAPMKAAKAMPKKAAMKAVSPPVKAAKAKPKKAAMKAVKAPMKAAKAKPKKAATKQAAGAAKKVKPQKAAIKAAKAGDEGGGGP